MMETPTGRIETPEQATNFAVSLCQEVVSARAECNIVIPDDKEATARAQDLAYQRWCMKYGQAVGTVIILYKVKLIGDEAYRRLMQQVVNTLAASVVGVADPQTIPSPRLFVR